MEAHLGATSSCFFKTTVLYAIYVAKQGYVSLSLESMAAGRLVMAQCLKLAASIKSC